MSEPHRGATAQPVAVETRLATPDEKAAYADAIKTREQTVPTLNDYLQRLVTLDAALIGGGFFVAKGDVLPYWYAVAVLVALVASLVVALCGLMPTIGFFHVHKIDGLDAYRKWETGIVLKKNQAMFFGSLLLVSAFIVGVVGLVAKGAPKVEDPKPVRVVVEQPAR
jgi:hypothetical protein